MLANNGTDRQRSVGKQRIIGIVRDVEFAVQYE